MLSVVIPVHNETERIPLFLPKIVTTFSDLDLENEIIIVDDDSTDKTKQIRNARAIP